LLNEPQEKVLVDWCHHNSDSATPLHPRKLRAQIFEMVKAYPGKNWVHRFLSRHADILVAKPRGLDPKRAQNFNKATITEYFDMRKALDDKLEGIPPEHNWNVDEKGCQMGGGRKGDNSKFIFSKNNRERYRIHSDNLELVTIIECVSETGQCDDTVTFRYICVTARDVCTNLW
ncbi:hypothetical protein BDR04DRAFT_1006677, partial [Suillus decipiens]